MNKGRFRCGALSDEGKQCGRRASKQYSFGGNPELDSDSVVGWVLVPFCKYHADVLGEKEPHFEKMARYKRERSAAIRSNNAEKERKGSSK